MGMRTATAAELAQEQRLFVAAWEMVKKYRYISGDDGWAELVDVVDRLGRQGAEGTPCRVLAEHLGLAVVAYLEAVARGGTRTTG